ncbi:MAG TPA: chaperone modulator CbpM [Ramlibacter sp.]|nr:chaperone modulator CbpM [Ramlibacter sp.]
MSAQAVEAAWLEGRETVTRAELARSCDLSEDELRELEDYGALSCVPAIGGEPLFAIECLPALRHAARLRRDFDLDLFAVAMLVQYLERIGTLERQVRTLQAHAPFHKPPLHREGPQPWREPHG